MNSIGNFANLFWTLLLGLITLYVFFVALGAFAPGEVWIVTIAVAVAAALSIVHFLRLRRALAHRGPNEARRKLNAMRERRGF